MNYKNISVPFRDKNYIKNRADLFRQQFWDDSIPVNIEKIIDVKLKIEIILIENLESLCDTDALITSNWQSIYIDQKAYLDDRYQNRLRFSLGHEIGHFVLHKNIYSSFNIQTISDFYKFLGEIPKEQYGYLEIQANKFANYLLVPREKLNIERNKLLKKYEGVIDPKKQDITTLNSYIANPISRIFGVSTDVTEIALSDISTNTK